MGFFDSVVDTVRQVRDRGGKVADQIKGAGESAVRGDLKGAGESALGAYTGFGIDPQALFQPAGDAPGAPGGDGGLAEIQKMQKEQAKAFRASMPAMQRQLSERVAQNSNEQLSGNLKEVDRQSNSRGLLYGGMNAGMRGAERANAQKGMANARLSINKQLVDQANQMENAAIGTGLQIQQSQQAIQDQIYNQALQSMMRQNQGFSSMMGAAGMVGGAMLGGPAGAMAGGAAGSAAGGAMAGGR